MSYYTGSISTGKLTADTVTIYPDTSNSIVGGLQAVEVNTGTLTANTVNATVFNFEQANLDVSANVVIGQDLTVGGNTTLNNLHVTGTVQLDNLVIDSSNSEFNNLTAVTATIDTLDVTGDETVNGSVTAGSVSTSGSVTAGSVSTSGSVTAGSISSNTVVSGSVTSGTFSTNAGFTVDASGNLVVPGSELLNGNLNVTGTTALNNNTFINGQVAILGNEYLSGNAYINDGVTVGDSSNGYGVSLNVTGNTLALTQTQTVIDASGIVTTTIAPANLVVDGAVNVSSDLDVSGNLTVEGTTTLDVLEAGATTVTGDLVVSGTVDSGSLSVVGNIDASGDLVVSGTVDSGSLSVVGNIDASGDLVVSGSTIINILETLGTASFEDSVNVTGNEAVQGGFYTDGGVYVNNNFVVGDGSEGDGVSMHTTGTTLNIFGVTQDSSAIAFPITVNVVGHLTIGTHFNTATPAVAPTVTDSSNVTGTPTISGSDMAGLISFQPNTVNPPYVTVTFGVSYANAPIVMISPANIYAATGGDLGYISGVTTSGFRLNITGNGTSNTYGFNYFVIGK